MKATITHDGDLIVSPENDMEAFSLRMWAEQHAQGRASFVVSHRRPATDADNRHGALDDARATLAILHQMAQDLP